MKRKNETERKKRETIRRKRREKRKYGFVLDEPEFESEEEIKKKRRLRFRRFFIVVGAVMAVSLGYFSWARVDSSRYVEVGATVVRVFNKQYSIPIFASRTTPGGSMPYYAQWVKVQYVFEDAEYQREIRYSERVGSHVMVFCNKINPGNCRATKIYDPFLYKFSIGVFVVSFILMLLALLFYNESDEKS